MAHTLDKLKWRYATKKFDTTKKIRREDLDTLLEATRLSASSYGLQPYHVYIIENQDTKDLLKTHSWGQTQVSDASHLMVLASKVGFKEELVDDYLDNLGRTRNIPKEKLEGYGSFMKKQLIDLKDEDKAAWSAKQVYLALGNVMTIAAEMEIDTCPLEGFIPEKYNEILGLEEKKQHATVALAIGYRSAEDDTQHHAKVRYPKEELITYL